MVTWGADQFLQDKTNLIQLILVFKRKPFPPSIEARVTFNLHSLGIQLKLNHLTFFLFKGRVLAIVRFIKKKIRLRAREV